VQDTFKIRNYKILHVFLPAGRHLPLPLSIKQYAANDRMSRISPHSADMTHEPGKM